MLAVSVAVLVVPAIGHPTEDVGSEIEETATTVKHGIRGWLKNVQAKIVKHEENCTHGGGVIRWVKNKLGLSKKTTTETPTTTTTTAAETDYSGYLPVTSVVNQGEPEEPYNGGDDDVTILDDSVATVPENDSGNESVDVDSTYSSATDNVVDTADPDIDVRIRL